MMDTLENKKLTAEQYKQLQAEVLDKIVIARVGLLLRHPFFGNMATRLQIKECDDWCPTAATDGRNLYYNVEFFSKLSNKEIEFVIAHEILHCVFDHMTRRQDRDPQLHNIACDYIVNNTLVRDNIGEKPKDIQIFQDWKYDGWSSEAVYDDIYKQGKKQLEKLGKLLDEHIDWENGENTSESNNQSKNKKQTKTPTFSKEELEKIKDEIKDSMLQASQTAGPGNLPKEVERVIKQFTEPKMSWREMLQTQVQSVIKNDYTFQRPSRKAWHSGAVLPGNKFDQTIDICVAIDTSGSIRDEQVKIFLGEVQNIMSQYADYKIKVWCFDTAVHNEQDFTPHDDDLESYKIEGGGGTEFMVNWDYMKEHGIEPKKFIMFTDGYAWNTWGDPDYCDTVFVIHGNHDRNIEAPFGITAQYED